MTKGCHGERPGPPSRHVPTGAGSGWLHRLPRRAACRSRAARGMLGTPVQPSSSRVARHGHCPTPVGLTLGHSPTRGFAGSCSGTPPPLSEPDPKFAIRRISGPITAPRPLPTTPRVRGWPVGRGAGRWAVPETEIRVGLSAISVCFPRKQGLRMPATLSEPLEGLARHYGQLPPGRDHVGPLTAGTCG